MKNIMRETREGAETLPVESLGRLPDFEVLDSECMLLQTQYNS